MKDIARWITYAGIFAVPFIPLIIANSLFFPFITGKNFTFRIIVEIIVASWIILALYEPIYRPKFSFILAGFAALLGIMFFADLFGEYPLKSFWSNFERMEGYVTLVHVFLYFIVVGSVLTTEKMWNRFFNTTLISAVILALYAFAQLSGNIAINQGGWRLDGTLGNSTYMAVYTLFHVFIALFMLVRTKSRNLKFVYGALVVLFTFLLIQTATRGAMLGLVGGSFLSVAYIALFSKGYPDVRKVASGFLIGLVVVAALFITFKDSSFVQENQYLQRIASISLEEGGVRFKIWSMAYEGFKERPLLGWGQGNFSYIFNKYYNPELYAAEQWFDRVHNIVFDWLVAGGILGFLAYLSILVAALYYIFFRPLIHKDDESFTVVERGILLGLLAGYTFHNLFVFDNIVSYIFYGTILAFIHSRVSITIPRVQSFKIDARVAEQIAAPVVGVLLVVSLYYVNVPGYLAAGDIIKAFSAKSPEQMIAAFDKALSRNSFGNQEIREQMTRQVQSIIQVPQVPEELKQLAFKRTEEELLKQIEEKPGDARVHVFISSFYRFTSNFDPAIEQLAIARSLSPKKQQIILEQALTYMQKNDFESAYNLFGEAYELETSNLSARIFYAASALFAGKPERIDELINTETLWNQFSQNDLAVQGAYTTGQYDLLKKMFETRIEVSPSDPQLRVNLAVIYQESGDIQTAVDVLTKAGEDIPSFAEQSRQFIADLLAGRMPGAQPETQVDGGNVVSPVQ